jgi:Phospholipase_D-nuclease N-terminal
MNVLAYDLVDVFWLMVWFFLFFAWVYLLVVLLTDIQRSHDLSGGGKAFWVACLVVVPLIGTLAYVIARGDRIAERRLKAGGQQLATLRSHVKDVAVTTHRTPAVDVAKLTELHERGLLTDEEYVRERMRALH